MLIMIFYLVLCFVSRILASEKLDFDDLQLVHSHHAPFSYHHKFIPDAHDKDHAFSYNTKNDRGPAHWGSLFDECHGSLQSPVNIKTVKCASLGRTPLQYVGSKKDPNKVTIENNGYSINWSFEFNGTRPYLTGGSIDNTFVLETMHIHWGGSEHRLNNVQGAIELHLIHRNIKYTNLTSANQHRDGLTVISLLRSSSRSVILRSQPMFKNMNDLRQPFSRVTLEKSPRGYKLMDIIGNLRKNKFYVYSGSLTTPPCSESVTWLVSAKMQKINMKDMYEIKKLCNNDWKTMPNIRPLQSWGDRDCRTVEMELE